MLSNIHSFKYIAGLFLGLLSFHSYSNNISPLKSDLRFQTLAFKDKISNVAINDLLQTPSGFVWIATEDGLNRFDGQDNIVYRPIKMDKSSISHSLIHDLEIDRSGQLWIGTEKGLNLFNHKQNTFKRYNYFNQSNNELSNSKIYKIYEDSFSRLWIANKGNGISVISADRQSLIHPKIGDSLSQSRKFFVRDIIETTDKRIFIATNFGVLEVNPQSFVINKVITLETKEAINFNQNSKVFQQIQNKEILVGTMKGLFVFNTNKNLLTPLFPTILQEKKITTIQQFNNNQYLIGTRASGLFLVNTITNLVEHFENTSTEKYSLLDNQITSIIRTSDKTFWIATNLGINIITSNQQMFAHVKYDKNKANCLSGNTIYAILPDSKGFLWIASFGYGLNRINLNTDECVLFKGVSEALHPKILRNIVALYEDINSDIWIGTYNQGVVRYKRNENKFEIFDMKKYCCRDKKLNNINSITGDKKGKIWISTFYNGAYEFDINSQQAVNFLPSLKESPNKQIIAIRSVLSDRNKNLWFATKTNGLWKFDRKEKEYRQIYPIGSHDAPLPSDLSRMIFDDNNNLWLGSKGEGAFKYTLETGEVQNYSTNSGLLNNVVMNIQKDNHGNIWFFTDKGLSRLSLTDEKIHTYLEKDGMQADAFTSAGFFDEKSKILWTGGINGYNHFKPEKIPKEQSINNVVITDFELFYRSLPLSNTWHESPLKKAINHTKSISLDYDQNVFAFTFSAMEFLSPERIKYKFMLEGYDLDWNLVNSDRRHANYTNLDPGEYTFRVKASNQTSEWNEKETTIKINIAYPWWQTNIAYISYILLSIFSIYLLITYRTKSLINRSRQLEQSVAQRTIELATEKQKVEQLLSRKNEEFANVSHEFRTPLTLILGPIAQLLKNKNSGQDTDKLNIVQRNGYRLLRMVDQLLNLETFRVKSLTQKIPQASGKIIKLLTEAFIDLAKEKNINLQIKTISDVNFEFTPDALEKIVVNLLSNAIKYTNSGGKITVESRRTTHNQLVIQVTDTGIGIPSDKLNTVFDRYSRVLDENSELVTGAGIGLSLVKSLVEAHQGQISIHSELGKGTTITVCLPIIGEVNSHQVSQHANNEIVAMELMSITSQKTVAAPDSRQTEQTRESSKPTLLVIEDNPDMRDYIVNSIQQNYQIFTAKDGEQGLNIAIAEVPDLIISDVMMPKMDGYQVTHQLRKNQLTNHIPIILLTARGDRESRLKGWFEKADEYLTKPFDTEELKIRLKSLLEIRDILKKRFAEKTFQISEPTKDDNEQPSDIHRPSRNKQQQTFVTKLNGQLETLYIEPATSIAYIASNLAMSERQLYRKLKSILDMTPSEYLRRFRLEKAKTLLEDGETVSFAAFEVGFSTHSSFSKCFKAQFGFSPRELKR